MNVDSIFKKFNKDINYAKSKFNNSKNISERQEYLNKINGCLNYLKAMIDNPQFPDFMKNSGNSIIQQEEKIFEEMKKRVDKIPIIEGNHKQGNNKKDDEDKEFSKGIANTIVSEKTNVKWDDVAGLKEAKASLNEALIMPIKYPDFFKGNVKPWRGILLYGPPGTGKTFLAKAAANECDSTFFSVSSSDLISKFMGESEKMIKELFKLANEKAPSIIFIDEIDSMCGARGEGESESTRRVKTEFLVKMQGLGNENSRVLVLGATNIPWGLDNAILRRFERRIYIELPDQEAKIICLKNKLKGLENTLKDQDFNEISKNMKHFSGADVEILVKDASMEPVRRAQNAKRFKKVNQNGKTMHLPVDNNWNNGDYIDCKIYDLPDNSLIVDDLCKNDFMNVIHRCKPSVGDKDLENFKQWTKEFGIGANE